MGVAAPNDPLVEAILDPMRELLDRYELASSRLEVVKASLRAQLEQPSPPDAMREPEVSDAPRARVANLQTDSSDVSQLLEFQERLSEIPGVMKVTIAGAKEGRSTFLIELAEEPQRVECTNCGKVLVFGKPPASHGLCDDCRGSYGAQER